MTKNDRGSIHASVLLNEVIDNLNLREGSVVLDGTFGGGGHSREVLRRVRGAKIIALDQDAHVEFGSKEERISFYNQNFRNLDEVLSEMGIGEVDGVILDLGLSSDQLENSGRGFSFGKDEPLLMTMKENPTEEDITAEEIVNTWSEESLEKIIRGYGEEKFSKRIAKGINERRSEKPIKTTFDLVKIVEQSIPAVARRGKMHFATRTFQALRIATNDELGALKEGLEKGFRALKRGGRMAVISFHSLEDRIVKNFYKEKQKEGKAILINNLPTGKAGKPIVPTIEEIKNNPRSRSAKLRVISRL